MVFSFWGGTVSKVGFGVLVFELGWFWRGGRDVLTGSSWSLSSWIVPLTQSVVGDMVVRLNRRLL